jgi:hypothetical protein
MITEDGVLSQTEGDYQVYVNTRSIASATVTNRMEHLVAGALENSYNTKNFLDIPAASIPGDAPALCMIVTDIQADTFRPKTIYIARDTKPDLDFIQPSGYTNKFFDFPMFAAGDAGWMTAWATTQAKTSGTGLLSNGSDATRYVVLVTPGTGALADDAILEWGSENAILDEDSDLLYHTMGLRGKYVVFMRNNVQTGSGSDIQVYLRFIFDVETNSNGIAGIGNVVNLPYVNPKAVTTTRNSEKSYALTCTEDAAQCVLDARSIADLQDCASGLTSCVAVGLPQTGIPIIDCSTQFTQCVAANPFNILQCADQARQCNFR